MFGKKKKKLVFWGRTPEKGEPVPYFLEPALKKIVKDHLLGVFRKAGSKEKVKNMSKLIDKWKEIDFSDMDAHTVSNLVKNYFRSFPEPMLRPWYDVLMDTKTFKTTNRLKSILKKTVHSPQYEMLDMLMEACHLMLPFKEQTKMGASNFALIFAPTLLSSPDDIQGFENSEKESGLLMNMMENYKKLFKGDVKVPRIPTKGRGRKPIKKKPKVDKVEVKKEVEVKRKVLSSGKKGKGRKRPPRRKVEIKKSDDSVF